MKYFVRISQDQAKIIYDLINKGLYKDVNQFISTAIENQINIERDDLYEKKNSVMISENEHDEDGYIMIDAEAGLTNLRNNPQPVSMPEFEELACYVGNKKNPSEESAWLWGQVNRIFPIKLGLRLLFVMLKDEQWIELKNFRDKAGDLALSYGKMIRSYERKDNKSRDEKVSTGLPKDNEYWRNDLFLKMREKKEFSNLKFYEESLKSDEFNSKIRYKAHFLAYVRKDGKFEGAMTYLRFVNIKEDKNGKFSIGLTDAGLKFAKLENPIIDNKDFKKSLNNKETDFYLDHILNAVKGESHAIKWLLNKLRGGINKIDNLNLELKKDFAHIWDASDAIINTQRAGLMARIYDLGLIDKNKEGINVTYIISDNGKNFLEKLNNV